MDAGTIWLYAEKPTPDLARPISLEPPLGNPGVEVLRGTDGAIKQVKSPQMLVNVKTIDNFEYHLECYYANQVVPGHQSNGFYATNSGAQPYVTWSIKNPDGAAGYTSLWVTEMRGGLIRDFKYTYSPLYNRWDLLKPDGQTIVSTWQVPDGLDVNITNYFRAVYANGQLIKKNQKAYLWRPFLNDKVLIQEVEGDGNLTQATTYHYYSADPGNGGNANLLQRVDYPDGRWEYYVYNDSGLKVTNYSAYGDGIIPPTSRAPIPTADRCKVTEYAYSLVLDPGAPDNDGIADDGAVSPWTPRRTIVKLPAGTGNALREVSRTYCHVIDDNKNEVQECPEPGALWDASGNLRRIYAKNADGKPTMECRPDGTVTLYSYSYDYTSVTVMTGKPNNFDDPSYIVEGTQTDTSYDEFGNILRSTTRAIQSSTLTDIVLADEIYNYRDESGNYLDPLRRDHDVVSLNGRTNQFRYGCCSLDRTVDADGVTTYYEYDPMLKTLLGTRKVVGVVGGTEQIIETTNRLNGLGRPLAKYRVGADGSVITSAQYQYDLLGRIMRETNALGGMTVYTSIVDSASQTIKTNIYPDGGVRVETYLPGGQLAQVAGSATFPMRYGYGAEQDGTGGPWREIFLEVKVGNSGETNEWTKTYLDGTGRRYKIAYAPRAGVDVSDPPSSIQYYNSQGQMWKEVDSDGVTILYAYNDLGEREYTITAVTGLARSISYAALKSGLAAGTFQAGTDRIKRTERSFVAATGGKPDLTRTDTFVWDNGQTVGSRISRSESAANGLERWSTLYGDGSVALVTHDQTSYGADGARTSITTMPDNSHTTNAYAYGRLVSFGRGDASGEQIARTDYGYDVHGRQNSVTDARNGTTTYAFNNADQVTTLTTPPSGGGLPPQTTSTLYDKMLRVSSVIQPDGSSTTNEYARSGLVTKVFGGRTYPVSYGYDSQGRMKTMTTWTNFGSLSGAATTTWSYNPYRGWLDNKRYADNSGPDYTYTAAGRLKTRTWARTGTGGSRIVTTYTYGFDDGIDNNEHGDLVGVAYAGDPQNTPGITQSYNRRGLLASVVRGGITTTLGYDNAGHLLGEGYSGGLLDGLSVTSIYDPLLRRTNVSAIGSSALSVASYGYDLASRMMSATNEGGDSATYTYLANSPLVGQIAFKNNGANRMATAKRYDLLNRLIQISSAPSSGSPSSSTYEYNQANQRIRNMQADGSYWCYHYDALGQITSGIKYWPDQEPVAGQQFGYTFDTIGNRRSSEAGGDIAGGNLRSAAYQVNALNEIKSRSVPGALDIMGLALAASSVTVNSQTPYRKGEYFRKEISVSNGSNPAWQSVTVAAAGETSVTGNEYVSKTPEQFAYDADGNLTSDGRWTYVWDAENRLVQMLPTTVVTVPNGAKRKLDFVYDYKGRRIQKAVSTWNGTDWSLTVSNRFLYDGWNLVAELNATNNALIRTYLWGLDLSGSLQGAGGVGGLLAISDASKGRHFVNYDGNGNVMQAVASADGSISAVYEYGPFGELLRATGPMAKANPFRFSTKYQDDDTDLLCYGYRFYSASIGRWLSREPLAEKGGLNLYGFVRNDPLRFVDIDGQQLSPPVCNICGQVALPEHNCVPRPPTQYPEGFAVCTRYVDIPGVLVACLNSCGGEHTYVQYVSTLQPPFIGPPYYWGMGFNKGGLEQENKFHPTKCSSCVKTDPSKSDAEIRDCISHHKPKTEYTWGWGFYNRYVCFDWAWEAAGACGLSCH